MDEPTEKVPPEETGCKEGTDLQEALNQAQKQAEEYLNSWKRAQADYVNLRRQSEQERQETARTANSQLILAVLAGLDDLDRALETVPPELAGNGWAEGIGLIGKKLHSSLEAQGLQPIKSVGELFNPHVHEACTYQKGPEGKVLVELQKGYTLHDRLLRPSQVIVGSDETGEKKEE